MRTIEIPVCLPTSDALKLAALAEHKHCTVPEMVEEAVALLLAREYRDSYATESRSAT